MLFFYVFFITLVPYEFQKWSYITQYVKRHNEVAEPFYRDNSENYLLLEGKTDKYILFDINYWQKFTNTLGMKVNIIVKRGNSQWYPNKIWNNLFAADYNSIYLYVSKNRFEFTLGRIPLKWGPSPLSSLLFSGYEPGIDLLRLKYTGNKIIYDYVFSILRDNEPSRFLQAHGIFYRPIHNLVLSFKDVIIYKTNDNIPDLYYINPFTIYYLRQWLLDSSGLTNSVFDFTGEYKFKNLHFYGELMIDDFPYIKVYHENPRMGFQIGMSFKARKHFTLIEYTRINRFTYCYYSFGPELSYKYFKMPLGHSEGNDFDKLEALYLVGIKNTSFSGIEIFYKRKGEGNIYELYRSTDPESEHYFLSGVIEKTVSFTPVFILNFRHLGVYTLPSLFYIKNYRHELNKSAVLFNITMGMELKI